MAAAAAALTAASARAMGTGPAPGVVALAFCGTVVVYTVDRLRDLERDRATAPARSAFVARHRSALVATAALCAAASGALALAAGAWALALAAGVAALGLAHRRLKHVLLAKPLYLTAAWTAVAVGLPALAGAGAPAAPRTAAAVAAVVGPTLLANAVLSSLRDEEGAAARLGRGGALALTALLLGGAGAVAVAVGPRALLPLPAAMALAAAGFRPGERYGLWAVDGALLLGGLLAWAAATGTVGATPA